MKALYAISDVVKDQAIRQGFLKTKTIYNGILTDAMKTKVVERSSVCHYKLVQVSRLNIEQKGQDILISALGKLLNTFHIDNFTLYLIGVGNSEDMLLEMVNRLGLKKHVCFEGLKSQEYIYNNLCNYDLFVQPSRYEGFGLTVAEAMAAKLPVLVSDIEGPMEVIGYGKYGMAFKSEDVDDLANKLEIVLKGGYDYSLIEKGYQHVCEEYDVRRTAQKYIQEYKHVLKNN
jgi:glycosyltransferase involved in cell wall biosynthesis